MANILVGIGGGISAFKTVALVRQLTGAEHNVRVVMTHAATRFVGPVTFAGITGQPAVTDLWDPETAGEQHVELSAWADVMVIAPATANLLARAAHGMADDAVLATLACWSGPVVFAPAMHTRMWEQPATRSNVALLQERGWRIVGPTEGPLASGDVGTGRMEEPATIASVVDQVLSGDANGDLEGLRVLVTAGPTQEPLDPVRFLSNHSTGKMGFAIAKQAHRRGADVQLIAGPTPIEPPQNIKRIDVQTAQQMHDETLRAAPEADIVIMTAAVSDYRPAKFEDKKIKKGDDAMQLTLVRNPDILKALGERRAKNQVLVGFALETHDVVKHAQDKLVAKGCDLIVANEASAAFGKDTNQIWLVSADGVEAHPSASKLEIGDWILDWVRGAKESR